MSVTIRARLAALLLTVASIGLAGCESRNANNGVVLENVQATWEISGEGMLTVAGQAWMKFSFDSDFSSGRQSTVWVNAVFLVLPGESAQAQRHDLSWVSTEQGVPFEVDARDQTPVLLRFGGDIAATPSELCGVGGVMDIYFSLGDSDTRAPMNSIQWPAAADPCIWDAGVPSDAGH
jgi:hypothetical protein